MKQKLFALLAGVLLCGAGTALAQCPHSVSMDNATEHPGFCLTSPHNEATLRFGDVNDGELQFFETDKPNKPQAWQRGSDGAVLQLYSFFNDTPFWALAVCKKDIRSEGECGATFTTSGPSSGPQNMFLTVAESPAETCAGVADIGRDTFQPLPESRGGKPLPCDPE